MRGQDIFERSILLVAFVSWNCAPVLTGTNARPGTAPDAATMWTPPPGYGAPEQLPSPPVSLPPDLPIEQLANGGSLTLAEVVDIALRNNPSTRDAWQRAQSAAQTVGREKSAYFPTVTGRAVVNYQKENFGRFAINQLTGDPGLGLAWTLLDFGARKSRVTQAELALLAADFAHDQTILDVVLLAEQAFLNYVANEALVEVEEASLKSAQASLEAARAREAAGLATRADVLQAQTALANTQLSLETVRGNIGVTQGSLAAAMGLPVTIAEKVKLERPGVPVTEVTLEAGKLVEEAVKARPDLAAARERALAAAARIEEMRAQYRPTVTLSGTFDQLYWFYYATGPRPVPASNYSAVVGVNIPIFSGYSTVYDVRKAQADAEDAKAQAAVLEQQATVQVWTSYYDLQTAKRRIDATAVLLSSARESYDVALGRYREGVGTILDLLAAQSALANAQGTDVQARATWYAALAQLAHDLGLLDPMRLLSKPTGISR